MSIAPLGGFIRHESVRAQVVLRAWFYRVEKFLVIGKMPTNKGDPVGQTTSAAKCRPYLTELRPFHRAMCVSIVRRLGAAGNAVAHPLLLWVCKKDKEDTSWRVGSLTR